MPILKYGLKNVILCQQKILIYVLQMYFSHRFICFISCESFNSASHIYTLFSLGSLLAFLIDLSFAASWIQFQSVSLSSFFISPLSLFYKTKSLNISLLITRNQILSCFKVLFPFYHIYYLVKDFLLKSPIDRPAKFFFLLLLSQRTEYHLTFQEDIKK